MYKNMSTDELAEIFVDNLVATNRGFNFYVNWGNTLDYRNFEIELNAMNVLIRCDDIHSKFVELARKIPTVIATFPLLFALSKNERKEVWKGKNDLQVVNEDLDEDDDMYFYYAVTTRMINEYYDNGIEIGSINAERFNAVLKNAAYGSVKIIQ